MKVFSAAQTGEVAWLYDFRIERDKWIVSNSLGRGNARKPHALDERDNAEDHMRPKVKAQIANTQ
jgi:hypothetical protein